MTDPGSPQPVQMPPIKMWRRSLAARIRNYFLAGLLVTAPISITIYFAWLIIDYVDSTVTGLIPAQYSPNVFLPFAVPGLGILILAVVLTLVGFLTANFLGRMAVRLGERIVARLPIIRSFYGAVKQIFETVFSKHTQSFREVVMVEYPRRDMWTVGLVIGKAAPEIQHGPEELISVFIPTMSFTSGYLVFLPRKDMRTVDMTVEECLKMVVSGGIVTPGPKSVTDRR